LKYVFAKSESFIVFSFVICVYLIFVWFTSVKPSKQYFNQVKERYENHLDVRNLKIIHWNVDYSLMYGPEFRCTYRKVWWHGENMFKPISKNIRNDTVQLQLSDHSPLLQEWKRGPLVNRSYSGGRFRHFEYCLSLARLNASNILYRAKTRPDIWYSDTKGQIRPWRCINSV